MSFIQRFFLRLYAIELEKAPARRSPAALYLGPYGEARMRTVLLLVVIMSGLGSSALVVGLDASEAARAFLVGYRPQILMAFGVASVVASALLVNRSVAKFKYSPQSASSFGSERDRWITSLQFYSILVCSVAAPIVTGILLR